MGRRRKLVNKKAKKKAECKCCFCGVDDYSLLDLHRIKEGAEGGEYTDSNTIVCCATCHRRVHSGQIKIDRKYRSTNGWVLHYWFDTQEFWIDL